MSSHFKPVLPGFDHVKRFWDGKRHKVVAKVLPGEFYVSKSDELITTVLGSCIAACIYDEGLGIGGMNHFMLPAEKVLILATHIALIAVMVTGQWNT